MNASDARTSEQKSQSDLATGRDARTANAMESARLKQEKADLAANTPAVKPASTSQASQPQLNREKTKTKKQKKKTPTRVSAPGTDENKNKSASKKSPEKKATGKS